MAFITVSDEYDTIDVIVFPNEINLINDLKNNDIVLLRGKVEKRMSKYQVLLENITHDVFREDKKENATQIIIKFFKKTSNMKKFPEIIK